MFTEDSRTISYTYDGMRRVTHMDYPDGWQEDYTYDAIGQLLAIEDTDPSQKTMKQQKNTFEYDVCGNMTHEYMRGNGTGETTTDVTYTYDELHRVLSATELYGNARREYQYDSLGNLTYEQNNNNVHYDYKINSLNQLTQKSYGSNNKEGTLYTYDKRGNLIREEYGKLNGGNNKRQVVAEYTYDETDKMVKGVNSIGESSSYLINGKDALVEQTWHIAKNGYGYHDVDAGIEDDTDADSGKGGNGSGGKGHGNGNGQGNGNGKGDKPTGSTVGSFSTVVKQYVIDYTREAMDPLMEHEVNGLDYRYVYGNERLSVNVSPITNGSGHIVETGTVGQQVRLYYHQDLRGTVDYLTSPVSQKVESWTHYNEWGEITHNAVLKCGQRELDLVKNFTGHDFDAVLNMYYAKARMYDAENRRFVSMDPILDGTRYDLKDYTTEAVNFTAYVYVKDNPLRWVDPLGLENMDPNGTSGNPITPQSPKYIITETSTLHVTSMAQPIQSVHNIDELVAMPAIDTVDNYTQQLLDLFGTMAPTVRKVSYSPVIPGIGYGHTKVYFSTNYFELQGCFRWDGQVYDHNTQDYKDIGAQNVDGQLKMTRRQFYLAMGMDAFTVAIFVHKTDYERFIKNGIVSLIGSAISYYAVPAQVAVEALPAIVGSAAIGTAVSEVADHIVDPDYYLILDTVGQVKNTSGYWLGQKADYFVVETMEVYLTNYSPHGDHIYMFSPEKSGTYLRWTTGDRGSYATKVFNIAKYRENMEVGGN